MAGNERRDLRRILEHTLALAATTGASFTSKNKMIEITEKLIKINQLDKTKELAYAYKAEDIRNINNKYKRIISELESDLAAYKSSNLPDRPTPSNRDTPYKPISKSTAKSPVAKVAVEVKSDKIRQKAEDDYEDMFKMADSLKVKP